ncbi:MAG: methionyl-tRNA formyltransferase [Akkermansiaceae bacterium]
MLKTVFFCNHQVSLFALKDLVSREQLAGVVTTNFAHSFTAEVSLLSQSHGIPCYACGENQLEGGLIDWLGKTPHDAIVVMTFPYKLPTAVLDYPPHGCWNLHLALLPQYRGPDPVFWSIKNGDHFGGITLHKMTERFDEGPILFRKEVRIAEQDVLGVHLNRVAQQAPEALTALFAHLQEGKGELVEQASASAEYLSRPSTTDQTIDWKNMDAAEIERLVRASNPTYQGAITEFRSICINLHEVEVIPLSDPPNEKPGTVVDAPNNPNLYVLCRDSSCLWIKVASASDGVFSGDRMRVVFDIASGEKFGN